MALGKRVRLRRKAYQLTQAELAALIGVTQSTIQSLEARDSRKSEHEDALARVLGVSVHWLRTGEGEENARPVQAAAPVPQAVYREHTLSAAQRRVIDKLIGLPELSLARLEPLIDELLRLQPTDRN